MATGQRRRSGGVSRWVLIGVAVVVAIAAVTTVVILKGSSPKSSPTTSSTTGLSTVFAPYTDMTLAGRPPLTQIVSKTGANGLHLAFVNSKSAHSCALAWDGTTPLTTYAGEVKQAVASGIEVIVSSGGAAGAEVAQACGTAAATQAQLQKVLDLGVRYLDFDVEGAGRVANAKANKARAVAIVALQKKYTDLKVSFTLAAAPPTSATAAPGVASTAPWVAAVDAGATIDRINLMTMNYGGTVAASDMGAAATAAATGLHAQIQAIQGVQSVEAWNMVGITPMIGANNVQGEEFSLANAKTVAEFVKKNRVGMLSYWATGRDHQCGSGATYPPVATCSGVSQADYAFGSAFSTVTR